MLYNNTKGGIKPLRLLRLLSKLLLVVEQTTIVAKWATIVVILQIYNSTIQLDYWILERIRNNKRSFYLGTNLN